MITIMDAPHNNHCCASQAGLGRSPEVTIVRVSGGIPNQPDSGPAGQDRATRDHCSNAWPGDCQPTQELWAFRASGLSGLQSQ